MKNIEAYKFTKEYYDRVEDTVFTFEFIHDDQTRKFIDAFVNADSKPKIDGLKWDILKRLEMAKALYLSQNIQYRTYNWNFESIFNGIKQEIDAANDSRTLLDLLNKLIFSIGDGWLSSGEGWNKYKFKTIAMQFLLNAPNGQAIGNYSWKPVSDEAKENNEWQKFLEENQQRAHYFPEMIKLLFNQAKLEVGACKKRILMDPESTRGDFAWVMDTSPADKLDLLYDFGFMPDNGVLTRKLINIFGQSVFGNFYSDSWSNSSKYYQEGMPKAVAAEIKARVAKLSEGRQSTSLLLRWRMVQKLKILQSLDLLVNRPQDTAAPTLKNIEELVQHIQKKLEHLYAISDNGELPYKDIIAREKQEFKVLADKVTSLKWGLMGIADEQSRNTFIEKWQLSTYHDLVTTFSKSQGQIDACNDILPFEGVFYNATQNAFTTIQHHEERQKHSAITVDTVWGVKDSYVYRDAENHHPAQVFLSEHLEGKPNSKILYASLLSDQLEGKLFHSANDFTQVPLIKDQKELTESLITVATECRWLDNDLGHLTLVSKANKKAKDDNSLKNATERVRFHALKSLGLPVNSKKYGREITKQVRDIREKHKQLIQDKITNPHLPRPENVSLAKWELIRAIIDLDILQQARVKTVKQIKTIQKVENDSKLDDLKPEEAATLVNDELPVELETTSHMTRNLGRLLYPQSWLEQSFNNSLKRLTDHYEGKKQKELKENNQTLKSSNPVSETNQEEKTESKGQARIKVTNFQDLRAQMTKREIHAQPLADKDGTLLPTEIAECILVSFRKILRFVEVEMAYKHAFIFLIFLVLYVQFGGAVSIAGLPILFTNILATASHSISAAQGAALKATLGHIASLAGKFTPNNIAYGVETVNEGIHWATSATGFELATVSGFGVSKLGFTITDLLNLPRGEGANLIQEWTLKWVKQLENNTKEEIQQEKLVTLVKTITSYALAVAIGIAGFYNEDFIGQLIEIPYYLLIPHSMLASIQTFGVIKATSIFLGQMLLCYDHMSRGLLQDGEGCKFSKTPENKLTIDKFFGWLKVIRENQTKPEELEKIINKIQQEKDFQINLEKLNCLINANQHFFEKIFTQEDCQGLQSLGVAFPKNFQTRENDHKVEGAQEKSLICHKISEGELVNLQGQHIKLNDIYHKILEYFLKLYLHPDRSPDPEAGLLGVFGDYRTIKTVFEDLIAQNQWLRTIFSDKERLQRLGIKMVDSKTYQIVAASTARTVLSVVQPKELVKTVSGVVSVAKDIVIGVSKTIVTPVLRVASSTVTDIVLGTLWGAALSLRSWKNRMGEGRNDLRQGRYLVHNFCRQVYLYVPIFLKEVCKSIKDTVVRKLTSPPNAKPIVTQVRDSTPRIGESEAKDSDKNNHVDTPLSPPSISVDQKATKRDIQNDKISSANKQNLPYPEVAKNFPWSEMADMNHARFSKEKTPDLSQYSPGDYLLLKAKSLCNQLYQESAQIDASSLWSLPQRRGYKHYMLKQMISSVEQQSSNDRLSTFFQKITEGSLDRNQFTAGIRSKVGKFCNEVEKLYDPKGSTLKHTHRLTSLISI